MVEPQIRKGGIAHERALQAMATVSPHEFVPPFWMNQAYADEPLPIDHGEAISEPHIAAMVASLAVASSENVLEIGTGCGYQAAFVSLPAREVRTVEILPALSQSAAQRLERWGYANVQVHLGGATIGWPESSPTMRFFWPPLRQRSQNPFCRHWPEMAA